MVPLLQHCAFGSAPAALRLWVRSSGFAPLGPLRRFKCLWARSGGIVPLGPLRRLCTFGSAPAAFCLWVRSGGFAPLGPLQRLCAFGSAPAAFCLGSTSAALHLWVRSGGIVPHSVQATSQRSGDRAVDPHATTRKAPFWSGRKEGRGETVKRKRFWAILARHAVMPRAFHPWKATRDSE